MCGNVATPTWAVAVEVEVAADDLVRNGLCRVGVGLTKGRGEGEELVELGAAQVAPRHLKGLQMGVEDIGDGPPARMLADGLEASAAANSQLHVSKTEVR